MEGESPSVRGKYIHIKRGGPDLFYEVRREIIERFNDLLLPLYTFPVYSKDEDGNEVDIENNDDLQALMDTVEDGYCKLYIRCEIKFLLQSQQSQNDLDLIIKDEKQYNK